MNKKCKKCAKKDTKIEYLQMMNKEWESDYQDMYEDACKFQDTVDVLTDERDNWRAVARYLRDEIKELDVENEKLKK